MSMPAFSSPPSRPCARCGAVHHRAAPCPPDAPMQRFLDRLRLSPYAADLNEADAILRFRRRETR